jgi:cobalamin biosynthetic protein CobC
VIKRDHGGGLDAAIALFGGSRENWLDRSTGINPIPYPVGDIRQDAWTALPDSDAFEELEQNARQFWGVPEDAAVLAAPGASSLIARLPSILSGTSVSIKTPTYNEHSAAFGEAGWKVGNHGDAQVVVHPNNPDGKCWDLSELGSKITIIDESFCDVIPDKSHIALSAKPNTIVLKSFGKFWGLAGLRLGFAIGDPKLIKKLSSTLGPWQVSGPALQIGADALQDESWATETRLRLDRDAERIDAMFTNKGAELIGGTSLFRLYEVDNAKSWQDRLAKGHVWSRIFPYSKTWLRIGLPHPDHWSHLEEAI